MSDHKPHRMPSYGGALLECLLSGCELTERTGQQIVDAFKICGFAMPENTSLLAYGSDPVDPLVDIGAVALEDFFSMREVKSARSVKMSFRGGLGCEEAYVGVGLHFPWTTIKICTAENILCPTTPAEEPEKFAILLSFATLCRVVADITKPEFGFISTEELHVDEMHPDVALKHGAVRYTEDFFSEASMRELFDWYLRYFKGA